MRGNSIEDYELMANILERKRKVAKKKKKKGVNGSKLQRANACSLITNISEVQTLLRSLFLHIP